mmetsp:Transcript_16100/g.49891  ORF Transcript_16100/g.49891 Transcript_16100/m.49891 type:complete len:226 (+) Transcript_16100:419-1096(+)
MLNTGLAGFSQRHMGHSRIWCQHAKQIVLPHDVHMTGRRSAPSWSSMQMLHETTSGGGGARPAAPSRPSDMGNPAASRGVGSARGVAPSGGLREPLEASSSARTASWSARAACVSFASGSRCLTGRAVCSGLAPDTCSTRRRPAISSKLAVVDDGCAASTGVRTCGLSSCRRHTTATMAWLCVMRSAVAAAIAVARLDVVVTTSRPETTATRDVLCIMRSMCAPA